MGLKKEIREYLKSTHTVNRYRHILGVAGTARILADIFYDERTCSPYLKKKDRKTKKEFIEDCTLAALLHDIDKSRDTDELWKLIRKDPDISDRLRMRIKDNREIYHAMAGAVSARNIFNIEDEDILNSIRYHTTGRKGMSVMEKIVYLADYIEPNRDIPGLSRIRKAAVKDLDLACLLSVEKNLRYLKGKSGICPLTFEFRKDLRDVMRDRRKSGYSGVRLKGRRKKTAKMVVKGKR